MALSIARPSGASKHLPSAETLQKCMDTCTTKESAEYLLAGFVDLISHSKIAHTDSVKKIVETLGSYIDYLGKGNSSNSWTGVLPSTLFESFHQSLAEAAAKLVTAQDVGFGFAINNLSQILRRYHSNGDSLSPEMVEAMDLLFNGWLVKNNMLCEEGIIYETDKMGNKQRDALGNEVRTPAETFRARTNDPNTGFAKYVEQNNRGIKLSTQEKSFPRPASLPEGGAAPT